MQNDFNGFIVGLCLTYRRPKCLANAIACFLEQDVPANQKALVIVDDANQYADCLPMQSVTQVINDPRGSYCIVTTPNRFSSITDKYSFAASVAFTRYPQASDIAIHEDDDVTLGHHWSSCIASMRNGAAWAKSSFVLSTYPGHPIQEGAAGRFFSSIVVSRSLWEKSGGVVMTRRADFDQQTMARFREIGGEPGEPLDFSPNRTPGYCFRWASTGEPHGQGKMKGPACEDWWAACEQFTPVERIERLVPMMDAETAAIYAQFSSLDGANNPHLSSVISSNSSHKIPQKYFHKII